VRNPDELLAAIRQQLGRHGLIVRLHDAQVSAVQRGAGDGQRVGVVGLGAVPRRIHTHPRGELGWHVIDAFIEADETLRRVQHRDRARPKGWPHPRITVNYDKRPDMWVWPGLLRTRLPGGPDHWG
jgi:hypothetical protein